jgi:hypothetical protein
LQSYISFFEIEIFIENFSLSNTQPKPLVCNTWNTSLV